MQKFLLGLAVSRVSLRQQLGYDSGGHGLTDPGCRVQLGSRYVSSDQGGELTIEVGGHTHAIIEPRDDEFRLKGSGTRIGFNGESGVLMF
jgi:hypothetical protein